MDKEEVLVSHVEVVAVDSVAVVVASVVDSAAVATVRNDFI